MATKPKTTAAPQTVEELDKNIDVALQTDEVPPVPETSAPAPVADNAANVTPAPAAAAKPEPKMIQISEEAWKQVQDQLKMLYETADKGRIFNYENQRAQKKPLSVRLSVYRDSVVIGWRTVKDELVKHPTTGKTVGEVQEYELMLLNKDNQIEKVTINGYPSFTDARYTERIECEVTAKKEDMEGNWTYDVQLPDGRTIPLSSKFIN